MWTRIRRLFRWLITLKGTLILLVIAVFIGIMIGAEAGGSHETVTVRMDRFDAEFGQQVAERIERQIEEQIAIPPIPDISELSHGSNVVYVDHYSSSFGDTVNNIGTILVSLGLIWVGVKMMVQRRTIKEKS